MPPHRGRVPQRPTFCQAHSQRTMPRDLQRIKPSMMLTAVSEVSFNPMLRALLLAESKSQQEIDRTS